jgi:hypothetical protein
MATAIDTENSLISSGDAVEYIGSTGSTGDWTRIYDLVNVVASRMNAEAGRKLKARSYCEYYDGNGGDDLLLRNYPLTSTSVTIYIDPTRTWTDTDYQVASTCIILDTESGAIELEGYSFSEGDRNVQVQYTAGYTTGSTSVPGEWALIGASKEYLQLLWNRATKRDNVGLRTESFEGGSKTYENDLPWSVKQVLMMYRDRKYS